MHDMVIVDLGGHTLNVEQLKIQFPHARVTRFYQSYLNTIARALEHCRTTHLWVISSCCNYTEFDFGFYPVPWESKQIHCWASGDQTYGDTFLVPMAEFQKQQPEQLEWFHDINYHDNGLPRLGWPVSVYGEADLTQTIIQTDMTSEFHWFVDAKQSLAGLGSEPALWGKNAYQLTSFNDDNSVNLVPRCAKQHLKTQVYDYQHLVRANSLQSQPQDIVFISYDEPQADETWAELHNRFPQSKRIHGVEGMEMALKAAALASETPWFFAVFAKTRIHERWNFSTSPDRWQSPKHYIFYAKNTSNDLCYGHMGMIMYNRQMVLDAPDYDELGVDFTMSFPTETIPIVSVYGEFATDPYRAWRTAFREVSKLCQWQVEKPTVENEYRINVWTTYSHGDHAEWVLRGAQDGRDYYQQHQNDTVALKRAFRWEWLKDYFEERYPLGR